MLKFSYLIHIHRKIPYKMAREWWCLPWQPLGILVVGSTVLYALLLHPPIGFFTGNFATKIPLSNNRPSVQRTLLGVRTCNVATKGIAWFWPYPFILLRQQLQIPPNVYRKIVQHSCNPLVYLHKPSYATSCIPYVIGHGKNKLVLWRYKGRIWGVEPYPPISRRLIQ